MAARKRKPPASVVEALGRELDALRRRAPDVADSSLAASALKLAERIDDPHNSATSVSMCQRAYAETFERLMALAPADDDHDQLDELTQRRAARIGRRATA